MNFYPHFIGDYRSDTADLSLVEHGAYRMLLDSCYATENPLPAEKMALYRIANAMTPAERKAVDKVAERFFPVNGDGFRHNSRVDQELAKAHAFADAQSMRAHKRWHKPGTAGSDAGTMPESCPTDANHNHNQRKSTTAGKGTPAYPDDFESIWTLYPKRDGDNPKPRAFKAFRARVAQGHSAEEIRSGVERYAAWVRARGKEGTELVKQAATFFGPDKAFLLPWAVDTVQLEPPLFRREGVM